MCEMTKKNDLWGNAVQYFNARNLAGAMAACDDILLDEPDDGLAHWLLANIAIESGSPRAAAKHALSAYHGSLHLHLQDRLKISWALIVAGETRAAYNMLVDIDVDGSQSHALLFEAAQQLSMIEFPVEALRVLESISCGHMFLPPEICMLKGHLLSTLGNKELAEELLEDAIAFGAKTPRPHLLLSRLNLARGRARRIDRLSRLSSSVQGNPEWIAMVHYALFNELDAEQDHDLAWKALSTGASALHASLHYDAKQEAEIFDNLVNQFKSEVHATAYNERPVEDLITPIFIVGLPRTGTTLVEQILANHPDVCAGGELLSFAQQTQWVSDRVWDGSYDLQASLKAGSLDADLLGQRYLLHCEWRCSGQRFFTDKTPRNFAALGHILKALPHARIIHIYRDPIDACFSNFKMLFGPNIYPYSYDLDELSAHFQNYSTLMKSWNRIFPGRILNVSYEELVREGSPVSDKMLEFCKLSVRQDVLDIAHSRRAIMTESRSQLRSGIQMKYIGAWRAYEKYLGPLVTNLKAIDQ